MLRSLAPGVAKPEVELMGDRPPGGVRSRGQRNLRAPVKAVVPSSISITLGLFPSVIGPQVLLHEDDDYSCCRLWVTDIDRSAIREVAWSDDESDNLCTLCDPHSRPGIAMLPLSLSFPKV